MWAHNFLYQYGTATKFYRFVDNLFGFTTLLKESKCYISVLRYVSPNNMVYFSPHALFLQAWSQIVKIEAIVTQIPTKFCHVTVATVTCCATF